MIKVIKQSGAYNNPFFQACRQTETLTLDQLMPLARNWREVTRSFWLATCRLVGMLGAEANTTFLPPLLKIAAEDGGIAGGAVNGRNGPPHFLLWEELCAPLNIDWGSPLESEAVALIKAFQNVDDIQTGLAMVTVVETIAYEIIDAFLPLFRAAGVEEETPGYLTLHRNLEVEHARDMGKVAELTELNLNDACVCFCEAWADFWSAMHRVTFTK